MASLVCKQESVFTMVHKDGEQIIALSILYANSDRYILELRFLSFFSTFKALAPAIKPFGVVKTFSLTALVIKKLRM